MVDNLFIIDVSLNPTNISLLNSGNLSTCKPDKVEFLIHRTQRVSKILHQAYSILLAQLIRGYIHAQHMHSGSTWLS